MNNMAHGVKIDSANAPIFRLACLIWGLVVVVLKLTSYVSLSWWWVCVPFLGWFLPTLALSTGLYSSWQRGRRLKRLSRVLGRPSLDIKNLLNGEKKSAEDELSDLIEGDPILNSIMQKHGASRADLRRLYSTLLACGAGQWSRGHWVAASTLCYGCTLEFVLTKLREGETMQKTPKEIWLPVAFQLVEYFQKGKVGRV